MRELELIEDIRLTTVASPEHLQQVLAEYFGSERVTDRRALYRAYYWLAFAGVARVDAFRVKGSELNFADMVIEHNGRLYQIYPQTIEPLAVAATLRYITIPRKSNSEPVQYRRCDGDELLRPSVRTGGGEAVSAEKSDRTFKAGLSRYLRDRSEEHDLTYTTVSKSGFFYREYEREKTGYGEPDFQEVVELRRMEWKRHLVERSPAYEAKAIRQLTERLEQEYEIWKHVHEDMLK